MKAFIFDLNGTMIDDMSYHAEAWYDILNNDLGGNFSYQEVKNNMYGKNGELLDRMFGAGHFTNYEIAEISIKKEHAYQAAFLPKLDLIPGLAMFLEKAYKKGIPMAIGSAAIPFNIDFVLDNLNIRHYFSAIVSAEDVKRSKPDPETFLKAAELLKVNPSDCIVFEDAPKGVEAALNANMPCVVLTTTHTKSEFDTLSNIIKFAPFYQEDYLNNLL